MKSASTKDDSVLRILGTISSSAAVAAKEEVGDKKFFFLSIAGDENEVVRNVTANNFLNGREWNFDTKDSLSLLTND